MISSLYLLSNPLTRTSESRASYKAPINLVTYSIKRVLIKKNIFTLVLVKVVVLTLYLL